MIICFIVPNQHLANWLQNVNKLLLLRLLQTDCDSATSLGNAVDVWNMLQNRCAVEHRHHHYILRTWVIDDAKCIVVTRVYVSVCVYVCLSAAACLLYCTDPDVTWRSGRGSPLVVHCWADLQSVHGLRCYGNTRNARQSPAVIRQAHRTHYACRRRLPSQPLKSTHLQRSRSISSILRGVVTRTRNVSEYACTRCMPSLFVRTKDT